MKIPKYFSFTHGKDQPYTHIAKHLQDNVWEIEWDEDYHGSPDSGITWWQTTAQEIQGFFNEYNGWKMIENYDEIATPHSNAPIVSDGGSTDYYKLTITNKAGQDLACEMGDVIRAVVGNDFDLGNVLKACRRMYEASQGRGKKDVSIHYDANKIAYFSREFADWNEDF